MMTHKISIETMDNKLNELTNPNSIKSPKLLSQRYHKTLGISEINSPLSPPSLVYLPKAEALFSCVDNVVAII